MVCSDTVLYAMRRGALSCKVRRGEVGSFSAMCCVFVTRRGVVQCDVMCSDVMIIEVVCWDVLRRVVVCVCCVCEACVYVCVWECHRVCMCPYVSGHLARRGERSRPESANGTSVCDTHSESRYIIAPLWDCRRSAEEELGGACLVAMLLLEIAVIGLSGSGSKGDCLPAATQQWFTSESAEVGRNKGMRIRMMLQVAAAMLPQ